MSIAKKEEVCSHQLIPRLGEPPVGVPIKKRPVSLSDKSDASGMMLSMKSSSPAKEMSVSAADACCGKESFFNIAKSDTNMITKGKGITNSHIQDHANRSFTLSMANRKGVLFNGSNEIPSCAESDRRSFASVDESQCQKNLALDLQLASPQNGKNNNYGSLVKEEKADQGLSDFSSVESHKNVQIASEMDASSNSSIGKLPNLDLNVPLDPTDSPEGFPTMHESGNGLYHRTIQHQKAQVLPAAPISTISIGLGRNIDSTLNLSNGVSQKCGSDDVTLDLQLKPPARPELGIKWKGLAPAPELSLSLFGKPMDEPKALSAPNALFNSEPAGSSIKVSEEAATPGSDKSPVEKAVTLVSCNTNPQNATSSNVCGLDKVSNSLVKKEPEESFQQHILNDAEKTQLLERQSIRLANNCAESEKTDSAPQVPSKTGFDLNSDIFPNNSIHNGLDVVTDTVLIPAESLPDIGWTEIVPAVHEVEKSVKREESTSPVVAMVSGHSAPLMAAKSLPLESNVASPAVGLCKSSSQPSIPTLEAPCSDTVCKPPASHIRAHEDMTLRPCDANEVSDALRSSSSPLAEPLVHNSQDHATVDGMSQGSAEMDCSDDDNTVSRLRITNKTHGERLGNGPTIKDGINANNLCKELKKEHDSDISSLTNKVSMEGADDDKCAKIRVNVVRHAGERGHRNEVFVNEKSEDKQSLKSGKNSPVNKTDNSIHDVKAVTGSTSTDQRRLSASQKCTSPKTESTRQSPKTLDICLEKTKSPEINSERSPHGKQAASCSEDNSKNVAVKTEHLAESEEAARQSDFHPKDSALGEDSELDEASSSQTHSECGKVKSASEKSEYDKCKPGSGKTSFVQNERDEQLVGSHWRDLGHAYVNRNERWERFMESEREKNKGEYQGGRHASDMINQQRTYHRYGGRGAGSHGHPRNFRGPRNEFEIDFVNEPISGRRRPFEDDLEHLHRISHRRRRSPPAGCLMREMDSDGFPGREIPDPRLLARGQIEDLPDDMIEERFFMPHSHRRHAQGDHGFIHRERSHSPVQRRGAPMHFHRGQSPEAMHRSPPLMRGERTFLPHRRHNRRHDSPLDQIGHDERGMQRNMRRRGMIDSHQTLEGDAFEPPLCPAYIAELHAEDELAERRYRERRGYHRSLEAAPVSDEGDQMPPYHAEDDMEFAEGGGPRALDGRFRNRLGHRAWGEQEDGYRNRGPQGWRDGDSNDSRPKRRRY
ncbi:uncharacterized protein LOC133916369 [Phragmites australis]|uniref:uncharacterized protein LOC133916369 n=1 Tax=Phragmites australis TaxID=29695 RepID=UPI002D7A208B|nr:uncharacterized protein LOC133916369 [Phragmites australis]XP_062215995.1 uncharacterized protein LOC133916369 [Phragmites australis]XP_062215996.1 uncharacterized protein LOC133916369 [Phragmites australis]